jgi:hypothetical protein
MFYVIFVITVVVVVVVVVIQVNLGWACLSDPGNVGQKIIYK